MVFMDKTAAFKAQSRLDQTLTRETMKPSWRNSMSAVSEPTSVPMGRMQSRQFLSDSPHIMIRILDGSIYQEKEPPSGHSKSFYD